MGKAKLNFKVWHFRIVIDKYVTINLKKEVFPFQKIVFKCNLTKINITCSRFDKRFLYIL